MKLEELIDEIKTRLEILKTDQSKLYSHLPRLFKALEPLSTINKKLTSILKSKFLELNSLTDNSEIISKIKDINIILADLKSQLVSHRKKTYLGVSQKFYTEDYKKATEVYNSYQELIIKKENEIINAPEYSDRLHEPLKKITKKYGKCLHARLTGNLRILYKASKEKDCAIFLTIIPHDEMDKL